MVAVFLFMLNAQQLQNGRARRKSNVLDNQAFYGHNFCTLSSANKFINHKTKKMAEIHVEPKKHTSNSSWLWIVLAILIAAAVIYYLVTRNNTAEESIAPANTTGSLVLPSTGHTVYR